MINLEKNKNFWHYLSIKSKVELIKNNDNNKIIINKLKNFISQ